MNVTRRDLLMWTAGAAAGLVVTPVPWKVLDDVSIWSQNWPWIPQPARVPIEVKQSACTLCPNGCGLRARMAAGWVVGLSGSTNHPMSRGVLCPLGYAAHQLNWHPSRLRTVRHRGVESSWAEAQAAFVKAKNDGPIVIIDGYPGRAASSVLESFAAKQNGEYRVVRGAESRALAPYETWSGVPAASLGYDLENAQTILSFGAPLLDGWGMPGRFPRLWAERTAGMSDPYLRLIQIDSTFSRTASKAWRWIQVRDNSESALASGLARVLIEQNLVAAHVPIPSMTLGEASSQTGLAEDKIRDLARTLVERQPALVIGPDENPTIAAINVLLGTVGMRGGIVRKTQGQQARRFADATISTARAVVLDASVPWNLPLHTDAEVFRFAAWDGGAINADWLLPAPGFLEELTDVPTAPTAPVESYAVAPALVKPAANVESAAQFLVSVDATLPSVESVIHSCCEELFRKRAGSVHGKEVVPLTRIASATSFEDQLQNGAVWVGEESSRSTLNCQLKDWPTGSQPTIPENWAEAWPAPVLPPLASKLYGESNLRDVPTGRNL